MLSLLIKGLLAGILLPFTIGFTGGQCIYRARKLGTTAGFFSGLGLVMADAIYFILVVSGLIYFAPLLTSWMSINELQISGGTFLIIWGLGNFKMLSWFNRSNAGDTFYETLTTLAYKNKEDRKIAQERHKGLKLYFFDEPAMLPKEYFISMFNYSIINISRIPIIISLYVGLRMCEHSALSDNFIFLGGCLIGSCCIWSYLSTSPTLLDYEPIPWSIIGFKIRDVKLRYLNMYSYVSFILLGGFMLVFGRML